MFLDNKYSKWYDQLILKRKISTPTGYCEKHHALPKSLGGSDDLENLVKLTAREHFTAHMLLVRMLNGTNKAKMVFALNRMLNGSSYKPRSSILYERIRTEYALAMSLRMTGKPMSENTKQKLRGKARSELTKSRISETLTGFKMPNETRVKISESLSGRPKSESFKQQMRERLNDPVIDAPRRAKISASLTGKVISEETKRKISETRKRKHAEGVLRSR